MNRERRIEVSDKEAFSEWCEGQYREPDKWPHLPPFLRDKIWQYFAPHLKGEFPREGFNKLFAKSALGEVNEMDMLAAFERLWNGEPTKGECPTCGGSREVFREWGLHKEDTKPCPDCTERPKIDGEEDFVHMEDMICRYGSPKGHVHTHACTIVDQRKKQQRKHWESHGVQCYPDGESYKTFHYKGEVDLKNRRTGDRRGQ